MGRYGTICYYANLIFNLGLCQALAKGTVDLHGLYVSEALEYAKKELESAMYRNDDKIYFITGASFGRFLLYVFSDVIYIGSTPRQGVAFRRWSVEAPAVPGRAL